MRFFKATTAAYKVFSQKGLGCWAVIAIIIILFEYWQGKLTGLQVAVGMILIYAINIQGSVDRMQIPPIPDDRLTAIEKKLDDLARELSRVRLRLPPRPSHH